jgi:hypothetical protein
MPPLYDHAMEHNTAGVHQSDSQRHLKLSDQVIVAMIEDTPASVRALGGSHGRQK